MTQLRLSLLSILAMPLVTCGLAACGGNQDDLPAFTTYDATSPVLVIPPPRKDAGGAPPAKDAGTHDAGHDGGHDASLADSAGDADGGDTGVDTGPAAGRDLSRTP